MSKAARFRIVFMVLQLLVIGILISSWFMKNTDPHVVSNLRLVAYIILVVLVIVRVAKPGLLRGTPPARPTNRQTLEEEA